LAANRWDLMTTDTHGTCYGFDITSDLPLSFLRSGTGNGTPMTIRSGALPDQVATLLHEWNLDKAGKLTTQLFETAVGRYLVKIGSDESYEVDTRPPAIIVNPSPIDKIEQESMIMGTPAAVSMAHQGLLPFHAGSVDVDGQGIVLAATGTFGKTTLAGAFHAAGHRLLADDMSCAIADPEPALLPGPAVIRARPDVVTGFTFEHTNAALTTPGRTYFVLDPATRGNGDPVPLRAIVFLRISDGPIVLGPAPVADAVRDLFGLSFRLPTDDGQSAAFGMATDLVGRVPVWNLERPLTLESLPAVIETIVEHCLD
jgi:hypothetical protein